MKTMNKTCHYRAGHDNPVFGYSGQARVGQEKQARVGQEKQSRVGQNKKAFTLVELIIVITILAILATIAFISFQGYIKDSRDSNRLATLKNIETGLELYSIKVGNFPLPDEYKTIFLSGETISYQGIIGENVSRVVNMNQTPLDPRDKTPYYYTTGEFGKGYKILSYQEKELGYHILPQTYANDYANRYPKVLGTGPAIVLNEDNSPITQDIDLFLTQSGTTYKALIDQTTSITGSGKDIGGGLHALAKKGGNFAQPSSCPTGFIPVPGNPEFMQPGFCVAKYEMALERDLETSELNSIDSWNTWTGSINSRSTSTTWTDGKIVSASGKYPIARITQSQAIAACKSIGGHLITNNQWMTIARNIESNAENWSTGITGSGYISNGVSNNATLGCGATNTKTQYTELPYNWATKTGPGTHEICNTKRQLLLSNGETIWDLAGNVREHVNGTNTIDGINFATMQANACGTAGSTDWAWYSYTNNTNDTSLQCSFINGYTYTNIGPKTPNLNASNGIGRIYSYKINNTTTNRVFLRGGLGNSVANAGVFAMNLNRAATDQSYGVGFRCSL